MRLLTIVRNKMQTPSGVPDTYIPYYKSRSIKNREFLCHAPFNNMYFNTRGQVANCWLGFDDPEIYTPEKSIMEIWQGEKFRTLRENIRSFHLTNQCQLCDGHIKNGNFVNSLSKAYDNENALTDYPSMMEFELSNVCNLECSMCNGELSSLIRRNRDHLPKLSSPYGDKFVDDLREFIPYLKEARFNGGEPFLISIYYKIWDLILSMDPTIKIVVATNGNILNDRVKEYLNKGNFHMNISIDSLDDVTYRQIRIGGELEVVLKNFEYFKEYCHNGNRDLCIMINPMRNNWHEMPKFLEFCNSHNVKLWFNTIIYPESLALWNLSSGQLQEVYEELNRYSSGISMKGLYTSLHNNRIFKNFVQQQVKTWWMEAKDREKNFNTIIKS